MDTNFLDNQFHLIFDHIRDVIFVIDVEPNERYRFVSVNIRFLEATGLQESQVVGKLVQEVIPEPSHALVVNKYRQAIRENKAVHWQEISVYPSGEKTGEVTVVPVLDTDGNCTQLVGTVHDITEYVDASKKLARMTQIYSALSECNQMIARCRSEAELFEKVCQIAVDYGGMTMAWIGQVQLPDHWVQPVAAFGTGTEYLEGIKISVDENTEYGNGPVGTAIRTGQPGWWDDFQHHPGLAPWQAIGKKFGWGSVASLPLYCKKKVVGSLNLYSEDTCPFDGQIRGLLLEMAEDISYALGHFFDEAEREKEQAQLHMLSEVLKQSPSVVIMTNLNDIIEYTNPAFAERYGYETKEVIGKAITILQSGTSGPMNFDEITASLEKTGKWTGELVNVAKNGTEYIESSTIAIVYDAEGQPIKHVYAMRNITEQKHGERERLRLQNELQQIHKMESIGRLAGGIAHDFNNMLGVIIAYSEIAMRESSTDHTLANYLTEIKSAADRSANLTRQLLTFARKHAHSPKGLNPNDAVGEMLTMLQRMIGENITLDWFPGDHIWLIYIDPSELDQILTNLCINARDSISDIGRIVIETSNEILDVHNYIHSPEATPGNYVRLSISDNGCGIAQEDQEHIFEPFFTTKGLGEGTGLGLSTVYGIVEQNKGFINMHSELGLGTRFNIYLPKYDGGSFQNIYEMQGESFPQGNEHILLVEDEEAILNVVRSTLESCGYTVLSTKSPIEAVRIASNQAGQIRLLITDMIMPSMNGRDLAERISSIQPKMRILYISGYSDGVHKGNVEEGIHLIQKPFSLATIAAKVREILDESNSS